jgi:hypothetical protein
MWSSQSKYEPFAESIIHARKVASATAITSDDMELSFNVLSYIVTAERAALYSSKKGWKRCIENGVDYSEGDRSH